MKNPTRHGMIEAPLGVDRIRKIYDTASSYYFLSNIIEKGPIARGLELAKIRFDDKVLDVAVGPGINFLEILKKVDRRNTVYGVDLSPKMVNKARELAIKNGFLNFDLREGDARRLPFPDGTFDVLYNSYMLDLIPIADFPIVLGEFRRILKEGGRIVLVNFSKKDALPVFSERLYKMAPSIWHGCRPVLMESFVRQAGFKSVKREFVSGFCTMPSEIITGLK